MKKKMHQRLFQTNTKIIHTALLRNNDKVIKLTIYLKIEKYSE